MVVLTNFTIDLNLHTIQKAHQIMAVYFFHLTSFFDMFANKMDNFKNSLKLLLWQHDKRTLFPLLLPGPSFRPSGSLPSKRTKEIRIQSQAMATLPLGVRYVALFTK